MSPGTGPTPPYVRFLGRLIRPFPNFDFFFIKPVRRKAVEWLRLKAGDRVLDAGCGPGGSFPYLVQAVGASGSVVGIEISSGICVNARSRIAANGWSNVEVIESSAQEVRLDGRFDGLLMFAAPDVYASAEALDNILAHLRENARIVLFGAKVPRTRWGRIMSPFLRAFVARLSPATPTPDEEPWHMIAKRIERIDIEEYFFGWMFLASGDVSAKR